jgi:hypothetical protein
LIFQFLEALNPLPTLYPRAHLLFVLGSLDQAPVVGRRENPRIGVQIRRSAGGLEY